MKSKEQPNRDYIGYGSKRPDPQWPGNANVAVNFVINYEEGAEYGILEGDKHSESLLSDIAPAMPRREQRFLNLESLYVSTHVCMNCVYARIALQKKNETRTHSAQADSPHHNT